MKNILITAFLLLTFLFSNAQRFEKYYGGPGADYGVDVAVMSDQSIVSVGTSNSYGHGGDDIVVTKTDSAGVLLWSRYFGGAYNDQGKSIAVSSNDDIFVCGVLMGAAAGSEDIQLSKISKDGLVLWTKTFGGTSTDIVNDIVIRNNKIYMIGSTKSFGAGQNDIYFLSTDTAGTIITTKTIGTTGNDLANSITKTTDGNFLIGGRSDFDATSEVFVAKISILGDTLWTKHFDCNVPYSTSNSNVTANAIIVLTDKQILVAGLGIGNTSTFFQAFHLRLDSLGNTIYLKFFGSNPYTKAIDALPTSNGGYIISTDYNMSLIKFNNAGNSVWSKIFQSVYYGGGYQQGNFSGRMAKLTGGRFLFSGTGYILNSTNDIYIAKLDSNGVSYSSANPVISASGSTTFCQGDSVMLTVSSGYINYQWIKSTSTGVKTYLPGNSTSVYAKDQGGYICVMTKSNGVRLTPFITVNVNPIPTSNVTQTGSSIFCGAAGQSTTLTTTAGYTSYQWKLGGLPIAGATSNTYVANSSGSYTVSISNGCGTVTSTSSTLNANNPTLCAVTCTECFLAPCHPSSPLVATDNGSGTTYQWYSGTTLVQSSTNNTYYPNSTGTYTCTATNACGNATSPLVTVGFNNNIPNNVIQSSGPTFGCGTSNSVILTAPNTSSPSFQWYFNSNIINGATSSTYTALAAGDYTVSYQNNYSNCPTTISDILTFSPSADILATITATSGTSACSGTLPLTVNVNGAGVSYQWYFNNNSIGSTTAIYQASTSGTYYCRVYRPSCGYQNTNAITLDFGSPVFSTPVVNFNLCQGSSKNIYVSTNSNFYTYQWKLNGVIIIGATTSNYSAQQPGTFTCDVSNACSTIASSPITVTQVALPTPIISATGNTNLCPNQTCSLNTPLINGAYYFWKNGLSYALAGTNQNNYNASTVGSYTITVTDPNGCTGTSAPIAITSSTIPTASIVATDYPLICYGSQLLLKGKSYSNANYIWYRNNVVIPSAVDSFYNATSGGDFNYKVTNLCGTANSSILNVIFKAKPIAIINALSSTNFCHGDSVSLQASIGAGNTYTWYKNNAIINNALTDSYNAKLAGNYVTKITNKYGCYKQSNIISVTVPCKVSDDENIEEFNLNTIHLYPNPSNDIVYFEVPESTTEKNIQVAVYDTQGRQITMNLNQLSESLWTLSDLDAGVYILKVNDDISTVSRTFVIIK